MILDKYKQLGKILDDICLEWDDEIVEFRDLDPVIIVIYEPDSGSSTIGLYTKEGEPLNDRE